tara:strand:- start:1061 stop:1498 length:438 start_codon:yes stop_codon:yes gene_type:complete
MATETKNKGNPQEAGGSTTKQKAFPMISSSLLNALTPETVKGLKDMFPSKMERISDDDLRRFLKEKGRGSFPQIGRQSKPKLMKPVSIPDEPVKKGEKPGMDKVAGGFKTLNVAKGGMVRKKSAKKSKKAGRAAKRGYGMAKRGK